jgi:hypothetical protein
MPIRWCETLTSEPRGPELSETKMGAKLSTHATCSAFGSPYGWRIIGTLTLDLRSYRFRHYLPVVRRPCGLTQILHSGPRVNMNL